MCGIVGVLNISPSAEPIDDRLVVRMRDTLAHRGPDHAGSWVAHDRRIGLGHRRLSIIDLSPKAHQPMSTRDGTRWIVLNGEIYNHAALRRELEQLGRRFVTDHSDTEVVLQAYEEWGTDCLQRFRGMFAFALWDTTRRELWLVRDRIGVKPLYYTTCGGRFSFASEIKALLADPRVPRAVNERGFYDYLSFLVVPAPDTMFAGIHKLAGGTWLKVSATGEMQQHRYWDVWDHTGSLEGESEASVAERLLAELKTSVALRKVSDVPVGVFLSGGIDSSTNAALFCEGEPSRVKTFTIGYDRDYRSYPNELHHARWIATRLGTDHHERRLRVDDLVSFLPEMVRLQDEPIADPVCVPLYYLSKLARDHGVVVCQVGEGADELFCGYPGWMMQLWLQRLNGAAPLGLVKRFGLEMLAFSGRAGGWPFEYLRRGAEGLPVFWGGAEAFTEHEKQALLSPRLRRELRGRSSWDTLAPVRARFEQAAWEPSTLNWMTYLDLMVRLPELLLMRVDKMSMGVAVEARVPFLDHELVELALSIPTRMKLNGGELKHILKRAVRGLLPDEVVDRPKQGFGVPLQEWSHGRFGQWAQSTVLDFCTVSDLLDRETVRRIMEAKPGRAWYLLNLALWWRYSIDELAIGEMAAA
jgi:asparagine synthase (glutamine-hydrolysing)